MKSAFKRQHSLFKTSGIPSDQVERSQPMPSRRLDGRKAARGGLALLGTALLVAGCASGGQGGGGADYSGNRALTSSADIRSPASERVVDGVVDMVLSDRLHASFDEAARHPVQAVSDGQPLYAYLRASRPLGELAHPADPYGNLAFSGYPHLFLQIGDNQSLRIINTCYVTLTPAEARATDLVVPLAPLSSRVGDLPSDCWLETVTRADPVRQTLEVRLAGFPGKFESWLPVPDLLAVQPVEVDLSKGVSGYGAMLRTKAVQAPVLAAPAPAADRRDRAAAASARNDRAGAAGTAGRVAPEEGTRAEQPRLLRDSQAAATAATNRTEAADDERSTAAARAAAVRATAAAAAVGSGAAGAAAATGSSVAAGAAGNVAATTAGRAGKGQQAATAEPTSEGRNEIVSIAPRKDAAERPDVPEAQRIGDARPAGSAGDAVSAAARIARLPAGVKLSALTPLLPAGRQNVGTQRMATQLHSMTSTLLGREPSETYFIDRRWQTQPAGRGQRGNRQVMRAVAIFKGEECSWQSLMVSRKPGAGTLSDVVADGDEVVIPCPYLRSAH